MYSSNDRKLSNRQFQEAATQRKAANDTQYFWDLVNRNFSGNSIPQSGRKISKSQEEHQLFTRKVEEASTGVIDDNIPVQRSGPQSEEIPNLDSFKDLEDKVPNSIIQCLDRLKFDRPTPIQKHAVPLGLAGMDLMCCAQTGSGKTIAFLIPVITALDPSKRSKSLSAISNEKDEAASSNNGTDQSTDTGPADSDVSIDQRGVLPKAIVLAPTRELASQIHLDARRLTFFGSSTKCICVYGGNDIRSQLIELSQGCDIIIATPGRLNDLVDRGVVSLSQVTYLVLDEADRMLDMGFEPQIRKIVLDYDMPHSENRQTFMFSATFPNEIQTLAREFLRDYVWIAVGRVGSTVDNIKQQVLLASADPNEKLKLLLPVLEQTQGRTLIFVQKRKTATWVCDCLRNMYGITAEEIHGDRSQAQRENALKMFRDGHIRYLIATDVAARGLDVPSVTHVVQFDMPLSNEDFDVYIHRIGRTGRAGSTGMATSFYVPGREVGEGNGKIAPLLLRLLQENNQEVPEWFTTLDDLRTSTPHQNSGNNMNRGGRFNQYNNNRNNYYNHNNNHNNNNHNFGYQDHRSNQSHVIYQPHSGSSYQPREDNGSSYHQSPRYSQAHSNFGNNPVPTPVPRSNPRPSYNSNPHNTSQPRGPAPASGSPTANAVNSPPANAAVPVVQTTQPRAYGVQAYYPASYQAPSTSSPVVQAYPSSVAVVPNQVPQVPGVNTQIPMQPSGGYPSPTHANGYYDPYNGVYIQQPGMVGSVDALNNQFGNMAIQQQPWMVQQPGVVQMHPGMMPPSAPEPRGRVNQGYNQGNNNNRNRQNGESHGNGYYPRGYAHQAPQGYPQYQMQGTQIPQQQQYSAYQPYQQVPYQQPQRQQYQAPVPPMNDSNASNPPQVESAN